jgi:hypothetical protein
METSPLPHPAIDLSPHLYYQLVYTLTGLLPPPIDDSPEALYTRDRAAIAKVAALLPVNANEADLAAQCIAARAQSEDILRLIRENADDIELTMRLNAQYGSMVRTSLSVHGRLMRVQALRQKREAINGSANQDGWALHIAERSMLEVLQANAAQQQATSPTAAPVEAPKPSVDQKITDNVSKQEINSQDAALETWLSRQPWSWRAKVPAETGLHEAMAETRLEAPLVSTSRPNHKEL